jgi:polar amino acid transport system ATP-binding protein
MANASPIVSLRRVHKAFGIKTVLDDFSLNVDAGEKLAIIGPSGSGKSTLLRILMTLESVDRGDVVIDGSYLWMDRDGKGSVQASGRQVRDIRAKVGMVFQSFNLFPHMTALENITRAPIQVLGLDRNEAYARARALLNMVGLQDREDAYPIQLSGGEQQRIAIARAMAMQPKIMLLDEVTSALDPELVGEVVNVIRKLADEHELTMLVATHQMAFAREFADRVCFIEHGGIVEQGSAEAMFKSAQSSRTKAFLEAAQL